MTSTVQPRNARSAASLGFTLVEVLVILAIIAVLAGVLVPVVTNQIRKAETGRVTSDLNGIRTGVEAFISDVKRYPNEIADLSSALDGTDEDINGDTYPTGLQNNWDGPYIDRVMVSADSLDTGFGGMIQDTLQSVDHPGNNVAYLTVAITSIGEADFDEVDAVIDDGDGPAAGRLHFTNDTLKYLAIPIN